MVQPKKSQNKANTGKLLFCSPDLENMFKPQAQKDAEALIARKVAESLAASKKAVEEMKAKVEKNTPKESQKKEEKNGE